LMLREIEIASTLARAGVEARLFATLGAAVSSGYGGDLDCCVCELAAISDATLLKKGLPVICVACRPDFSAAMKVMQEGCFGVLDWPVMRNDLLPTMQAAAHFRAHVRAVFSAAQETFRTYGGLNEREKSIVGFLIAGLANKQIAKKLQISMRTVVRDRANILEKFGVDSVAVLARKLAAIECHDSNTCYGRPHCNDGRSNSADGQTRLCGHLFVPVPAMPLANTIGSGPRMLISESEQPTSRASSGS